MSTRYATIITDDHGQEIVSAIGEFEGGAPQPRLGRVEPVAPGVLIGMVRDAAGGFCFPRPGSPGSLSVWSWRASRRRRRSPPRQRSLPVRQGRSAPREPRSGPGRTAARRSRLAGPDRCQRPAFPLPMPTPMIVTSMTDKTAARPTRAKPVRRKPAASSSARKPRAKRAKKTLGDDFLAAVRADFRAYGAGVIAEVRADKPDQYLKIVLSVLPRDFNATINQMDGLSDDEIRSRIRALEAVVKPFLEELGDGGQDGISGAAGGTGPQAPQ